MSNEKSNLERSERQTKKKKIPSKLEVAPYALKMSTGWMEWSG